MVSLLKTRILSVFDVFHHFLFLHENPKFSFFIHFFICSFIISYFRIISCIILCEVSALNNTDLNSPIRIENYLYQPIRVNTVLHSPIKVNNYFRQPIKLNKQIIKLFTLVVNVGITLILNVSIVKDVMIMIRRYVLWKLI